MTISRIIFGFVRILFNNFLELDSENSQRYRQSSALANPHFSTLLQGWTCDKRDKQSEGITCEIVAISLGNFSFRIRFNRSPSTTININSLTWEFPTREKQFSIVLTAPGRETTIEKSPVLALRGDGWKNEEEALREAEKYRDALMLTLARIRVGADFGSRSPTGGFTLYGLKWLEEQKGQRVLNDVHGIMTFETEPPPLFALQTMGFVVGRPKERFEKVFVFAVEHPRVLTEGERLSLELFHASIFHELPEARFLLLMIAIEALLEPNLRNGAAVDHIKVLFDLTSESRSLSPEDKDSLKGALSGLRYESIRQTGRRFVADRLGARTYSGRYAPDFFLDCYELRSKLVHGKLPASQGEDIRSVVATLEEFVSDILSGPLLSVSV